MVKLLSWHGCVVLLDCCGVLLHDQIQLALIADRPARLMHQSFAKGASAHPSSSMNFGRDRKNHHQAHFFAG
jgi:hypothetical protein